MEAPKRAFPVGKRQGIPDWQNKRLNPNIATAWIYVVWHLTDLTKEPV